MAGLCTYDPSQWNLALFQRMHTEGWTRNPNATAALGDTAALGSTASGNAVSDQYASVFALPSPCYAFRYAAVQVGNIGQPGSSCSTGRAANKLDAVAGLDANGFIPYLFHRLPWGVTAGPDAVTATAKLQSTDIYFMLDTTASMSSVDAALATNATLFSVGDFAALRHRDRRDL